MNHLQFNNRFYLKVGRPIESQALGVNPHLDKMILLDCHIVTTSDIVR